MNSPSQLRVVRAAIKHENGGVYSVPIPGRHHNVIAQMVELGLPTPILGTQGFLISDGSFMDREDSKTVAVASGQRLRVIAHVMTSEELW